MSLKRRASKYLLLAAMAMGLWLIMVMSFWPGQFAEGDNLTYAILARNMIRGKGLVHQSIVPQLLANLGKLPDTDVRQPPVWPMVEAVFFSALGANDKTIMVASGFFWVLSLLMLMMIAEKLFSKGVVGLCIVIFLFQPMILRLSFSGLTEPLYIFLLLLVVYLVVFRKHSNYLVVGLISGLMKWTRSSTIFLLPAVLFVMWRKKARILDYLIYFAGFGFVELLFKVWRLDSEGGYYSSALARKSDEILVLLRDFNVYPHPSVIRLLGRLRIELFLTNLAQLGWMWLAVSYAIFIWVLFFWGLPTIFREGLTKLKLLVEFILVALVVSWVGSTLAEPSARYVAPLLVLAMLPAAWQLTRLLSTRQKIRSAMLLLVVIVFPLVLSFNRGYYRLEHDDWLPEVVEYVKKTNKGAVVTDQPVRFAWYSDSQMIFFPRDIDQVEKIDDKIIPISGILLTRDGLEQNYAEEHWWKFFNEVGDMEWYEDGTKKVVLRKLDRFDRIEK